MASLLMPINLESKQMNLRYKIVCDVKVMSSMYISRVSVQVSSPRNVHRTKVVHGNSLSIAHSHPYHFPFVLATFGLCGMMASVILNTLIAS